MFELRRIGNDQCRLPLIAAGDMQDAKIACISVKLLRGGGRADRAGLTGEPVGKSLF